MDDTSAMVLQVGFGFWFLWLAVSGIYAVRHFLIKLAAWRKMERRGDKPQSSEEWGYWFLGSMISMLLMVGLTICVRSILSLKGLR